MNQKIKENSSTSSAVYGMGFIGACVYFVSHASSFWLGVYGVIKAVVWPGILVYEVFKHFTV